MTTHHTIRISQYTFELPIHYHAGEPLGEGEALALNALRAENVRNNVDQWVAEAENMTPGGVLRPDAQAELQARIADYDRDYKFPLTRRSRRPPPALERAMTILSEIKSAEWAQARGFELTDPRVEAERQRLLASPELRAEAQRKVEAERAVAQAGLAALGLL